jgi:hypothetical protein
MRIKRKIETEEEVEIEFPYYSKNTYDWYYMIYSEKYALRIKHCKDQNEVNNRLQIETTYAEYALDVECIPITEAEFMEVYKENTNAMDLLIKKPEIDPEIDM